MHNVWSIGRECAALSPLAALASMTCSVPVLRCKLVGYGSSTPSRRALGATCTSRMTLLSPPSSVLLRPGHLATATLACSRTITGPMADPSPRSRRSSSRSSLGGGARPALCMMDFSNALGFATSRALWDPPLWSNTLTSGAACVTSPSRIRPTLCDGAGPPPLSTRQGPATRRSSKVPVTANLETVGSSPREILHLAGSTRPLLDGRASRSTWPPT